MYLITVIPASWGRNRLGESQCEAIKLKKSQLHIFSTYKADIVVNVCHFSYIGGIDRGIAVQGWSPA
jgi:hypothetical protein